MNTARPYQSKAVDWTFDRWQALRKLCLVAPTGAGKTVIAEFIARRILDSSHRVVFFAHKRELVKQTARRFEKAFPGLVGMVMADEPLSPSCPIQVVSIQTCTKRDFWPEAEFVMLDECFPAGTLIDGVPIERVCPGDTVECVDHETGCVSAKKVVRTFERWSHHLVRIECEGSVVECTGNHPFFVKGEGYVQAKDLVPGDLCAVWQDVRGTEEQGGQRSDHLLRRVSQQDALGAHGSYQPRPRERSDDRAQPDATGEGAQPCVSLAQGDWPQACGSRRERHGLDAIPVSSTCGARPDVESGARGSDEEAAKVGIPALLQAGSSAAGCDDWCGTGGGKPRNARPADAGQEKGRALVWARVDRVAHQEQGRPVRVYNLEVEGTHTYFANGFLVHNCHHYAADEWKVVDEKYPSAKFVGLTATPARQDGVALSIFEDLYVVANYSELLAEGFLANCKAFQPPNILKNGLAQDPLKAWQLYNQKRHTTFAFGRSVKYCAKQVELFKAAGIPTAQISYQTPSRERDYILECAGLGKILVLWSDTALTEGVDITRAKCALFARQFLHATPYLQAGGRVLRPWKNETAIIIDLCGSTLIHGLPTEDRTYSLDGKGIQRTSVTPLKNCPKCGATIIAAYQDCPECGFHFATAEQRAPKIWDLELREVYLGDKTAPDKKHGEWMRLLAFSSERGWGVSWALREYHKLFADTPDMTVISFERRHEEFVQLRAFAKSRGFKPGWAAVRWKQMFGSWPPKQWSDAA